MGRYPASPSYLFPGFDPRGPPYRHLHARHGPKELATLSDAEQRRLVEIETSFRVDDPGFVQQFDARWNRTPAPRRTVALLTIPLGAILTMAALVTGIVVAAVIGLCVVGTAAGFLVSHRIHH